MSLFSKIGKSVKNAASSALSLGQDQNEGTSGWGNGFLASLSSQATQGPDNTGTFAESMFDMTSRLGMSGAGTNEAFSGAQRTMQSWSNGGLGAQLGLGGQDGGTGIFGGLGAGLGGGEWSSQSADRSANGYSGGAGVNATLGGTLSGFGESVSQSAEVYRGAGGNAYQFSGPGEQGVGADLNYTPLGINNATSSYSGRLGNGSGSMENAVIGKMSASGEIGQSDDGTVFTRGSFAPGRTEVSNVQAQFESGLGKTEASLGGFGTGARTQANAYANAETGDWGGGAQWAGGGMKFTDGAFSQDFGGGTTANASFGEINTANSWDFNGGWDNETNTFTGDGAWSTGNTVRDAKVGFNSEYGGANASLGEYTDGVNITGNGSVDWGKDGSLIPTSASFSGNGSGGGFQIQDAGVSYGKEGTYYQEANVESLSTRTEVQGANLTMDATGVDASVESVRAGGFRMDGLTGRSDILGTRTDYSAGEISNDVLVDGAYFKANSEGVSMGARELDGGGIRMKDVAVDSDLGALGNVSMRAGSFTNGNNAKGVNFSANEDGVSLSAESLGIMGMDAENVSASYEGPGGAYANAKMGKLHTGIGATGVSVNVDGDGLDMSADNVNYTTLQLEGVEANYGVDGIYDASLSLDKGGYNSFDANNVSIGLDRDGLSGSAEDVAYSYISAEGLSAEASYFDGAVGSNLSLGKGSFAAGTADKIEFDTNLMESNLAVENLKANGLNLEDVAVGANVGDLGAQAQADTLNVLDLSVGSVEASTQMFGLAGQAQVQDANLDLLNVEGGSAMLSYGDQEIIGASGDYKASVGVGNAELDYNLLEGRASGSFEDANVTNQLSNASVNFLGNEIDIPDMGYDLNASGEANVDLLAGQASGALSLAGSSANFAGYEVELGEWAQASGAVDLSQGAVNANIGGENGVGVDASLADMNLDINLFGMDIDVDEGISDAADYVGDVASDAWSGISSGASYVASLLPSFSLW